MKKKNERATKNIVINCLLVIVLLTGMVTVYADTQIDSKSLLERVTKFSGIEYDGEGLISTTLTYSNITSPCGALKKGVYFPITGTLRLQSLFGNVGSIKQLKFSIMKLYSYNSVVAARSYNVSGKEINLSDYSSEISMDIANLPVGDYNYSLYVLSEGKLFFSDKPVATSVFSISEDGLLYNKPSISITGVSQYSSAMAAGTGFKIAGKIKTDYGLITKVTVNIDGKEVRSFSPNSSEFDLSTRVGTMEETKRLDNGNHTYSVVVTVENGYHKVVNTVIDQRINVSGFLTQKQPKVSISSVSAPGTLEKGSNFGLRGVIEADNCVLTKVTGQVIDNTGKVILSGSHSLNSTTHDIRNSINNDLKFGSLPNGSYCYVLTVDAKTTNGETIQEVLVRKNFDVIGGSSTQSQPRITISSVAAPSSLKKGSNFGLRGVISAENCTIITVTGQVINSAGKVVLSGSHSLNSATHDIRNTINNDLRFGTLSSGTYSYVLTVSAKTEQGEIIQETLVRRSFTVYQEEEEKAPAGSWGGWSDWSTTKVAASDTRQVETKTENVTKVQYVYKHWHYTHKVNGAQNSYAEYKGSQYVEGSGKWEYYKTDKPLTQTDTKDGHKRYKVGQVSWYWETKSETTEQVTYYRYRDLR